MLLDYPVLDEDDLNAYEDELTDEAWDAWLRSDTLSSLDSYALDNDLDAHTDLARSACYASDPRDTDDIVRCVYYAYEDNEWVAQGATSITNLRHDDAVAHVIDTVFTLDAPAVNSPGQLPLLALHPDAYCPRCDRPFSTHA